MEMATDPLEGGLDQFMNEHLPQEHANNVEVIDSLDVSPDWTLWRDNLAQNMFNDWRSRQELEKGMKKLLPGTDLVANPYINSKIHVWKKDYGALSELLSKSDIGWNDSTHTIDVFNEDVWEAKKRPYYGHWLDIFGKDRATEEHVVDHMDIVNEMLYTKDAPDSDPVEGVVENTFVSKPSEGEANTWKGKKRKLEDTELGTFVDTIGDLIKSTDQTFGTLAQCIRTDPDEKITRKSLNDIVKGIPGLSLQEKLKVCDDLVQNTK
ncbi:hypothetical protein ACS0TY_029510 [Phlomoides rotata]